MTDNQTQVVKETRHNRVCPWQNAGRIDNWLRKLVHNPVRIFGPYVKEGMTAMDFGCGGGFVSIELAKLVGESGKVISVDVQPQMIEITRKKAVRENLVDRFIFHQCEPDSIGVTRELDFAVAFYVLHETPDYKSALREIYNQLKPGGIFYYIEPTFHVTAKKVKEAVNEAEQLGFSVIDRPKIGGSHAVVLKK